VTVLLAALAGCIATAVLLRCGSAVLGQATLARQNYRGHDLPTGVGIVLVAAVIAVDGGRTLLAVVGVGDAATAPARLAVLAAVVMFGFLGLLDDLLGDANDRGLRGHLGAALTGRVTTGFIKLGGGAAVALVLAGAVDGDDPRQVLVDAAVIALAANLANLLDRAPGRTLKCALVAYVPVAILAGAAATGVALAAVAGSALVLLWGDLREDFMLGDTGANAIGAAIGVATVLEASDETRAIVAIVLVGLTLLSEAVSFTRIIHAVMPLRRFDQLGRRADETGL
jgi:UDP-GlcNAc:undecaprenyl-phosphate/decaprenyl-phosphate GlcNAc-1-phosphate transferase